MVSEDFEIDTDTVLQMAEDLDMENEHETGFETLHRMSRVKTWLNMELKELDFWFFLLTSYCLSVLSYSSFLHIHHFHQKSSSLS